MQNSDIIPLEDIVSCAFCTIRTIFRLSSSGRYEEFRNFTIRTLSFDFSNHSWWSSRLPRISGFLDRNTSLNMGFATRNLLALKYVWVTILCKFNFIFPGFDCLQFDYETINWMRLKIRLTIMTRCLSQIRSVLMGPWYWLLMCENSPSLLSFQPKLLCIQKRAQNNSISCCSDNW